MRARVDSRAKKADIDPEKLLMGKVQGGVSVMVGIGAAYRGLTAPVFVERGVKINGDYYQGVLPNRYLPRMSRAYGSPSDFWLQEDGAPAHTKKSARAHFTHNFPNLVTNWPASSSDLNPPDYGLWSHWQELVWAKKPKTPIELKCAIIDVCEKYPPQTRKKTIKSSKQRLQLCVGAKGGYFECEKN